MKMRVELLKRLGLGGEEDSHWNEDIIIKIR